MQLLRTPHHVEINREADHYVIFTNRTSRMYCRYANENKIQLFKYKDSNLFNMQRMVTQHMKYNVGGVFVIPRWIWWVEK